MKNKKGNISLYITFIFLAVIIVIIGAVFGPMGVLFNTEMYKAGENILLQANDSIQGIQNETVRNSITSVVNTAVDSAENNIEINANIFQYSWILIVGLLALIIFIATRRTVEIGRTGGFI